MISYDGKTDRQVTSSTDSESSPRWSPDEVSLLHVFSPRKSEGQPDLAPAPRRWRSHAVDRRERPPASVRVVTRFRKIRAVISDPSPDADPSDAPAKPKAPQAHHHRPLQIQNAGHPGLPCSAAATGFIYLFDISAKKLDRLTRKNPPTKANPVVPRRKIDRLLQQSRCGF